MFFFFYIYIFNIITNLYCTSRRYCCRLYQYGSVYIRPAPAGKKGAPECISGRTVTDVVNQWNNFVYT